MGDAQKGWGKEISQEREKKEKKKKDPKVDDMEMMEQKREWQL